MSAKLPRYKVYVQCPDCDWEDPMVYTNTRYKFNDIFHKRCPECGLNHMLVYKVLEGKADA